MINTIIIIILLLVSPVLLPEAAGAHAAVVINEIYPKPEDTSSEWIELYNTGSESVSLDRWKLENTQGERKEFIINASGIIAAGSFLTFNRSQTNITLLDNGDTVNLYNADGAKADSQSYASTMGTNRSAGRSPDGTGLWSQSCTTNTKNAPNDCVPPTPTTTPLPTSAPLPPPPPGEAPAEAADPPTAAPLEGVTVTTPAVLGVVRTPTPSPLPPDMVKVEIPKDIIVSKTMIAQISIVVLSWIILAVGAHIQNKLNKRKRMARTPPVQPPSA